MPVKYIIPSEAKIVIGIEVAATVATEMEVKPW